jgi:hypothetical protein
MAVSSITVASSGSTATDGTVQSLATSTTASWYQCVWDLSTLANGDIIELWVYTKTLTGSTTAVAFHAVYAHAQAEPVKVSPMIGSPFSITMKMKLTDGSNKTIDWSLNRV